MDKVDSMQEQIGDVSTKMEIFKNYEEHCNRNVFDGLASRLDTTEERICTLGGISRNVHN